MKPQAAHLILFFFSFPFSGQSQAPIAQVETAIPAFIGHTLKSPNGWLKPQKINSFQEFVSQFGGPAAEPNLQVVIDQSREKQAPTVTAGFQGPRSPHNLYHSLQAYFANGGGPCYIVPVGGYLAAGGSLSAAVFIKGLQVLEKEDEPTLIVIPEAQHLGEISDMKTLYDEALAQCKRLGDRFLIMDIFAHEEKADILSVANLFRRDGVGNQHLSYGAAYAPNLVTTLTYSWNNQTTVLFQTGQQMLRSNLGELAKRDKTLHAEALKALGNLTWTLPPSALVAGVYVQTDRTKGVWKAPANVELKSVLRPVLSITEAQQEDLNTGKSINAIRTFPGKGTLVWGARTLAGNDNEWRYVPVRRLALMIEESIAKGTQFAVFEPNDEPLWSNLRLLAENFLQDLWKKGALQGTKPDQAYFVRVGLGYTMTVQDILQGRLILEIGFAPLKPAEFVVIRIEHKMP